MALNSYRYMIVGVALLAASQFAKADTALCASYSSCTNFSTINGSGVTTAGALTITAAGVLIDVKGNTLPPSFSQIGQSLLTNLGGSAAIQNTYIGASNISENVTGVGTVTGLSTAISFKNGGAADETGLGFTLDPSDQTHSGQVASSTQNEIYYLNTGNKMAAIGMIQLKATGNINDLVLQFGSVQSGEGFQVYGSNAAITGLNAGNLTLLYSKTGGTQANDLYTVDLGNVNGVNDFKAYSYFYAAADGGNVVLAAAGATSATPEPASFALFATGLLGIGILSRRFRKA